jgi:hypothetical protein
MEVETRKFQMGQPKVTQVTAILLPKQKPSDGEKL